MTLRFEEQPPLPNCVAELRRRTGLSQEEFGRHVGVSRTTISQIEVGNTIPSVFVALQIARALGVRVEQVFLLAERNAPLRLPALRKAVT
jgi:DNA-binding XRE family transcriptional regulator